MTILAILALALGLAGPPSRPVARWLITTYVVICTCTCIALVGYFALTEIGL